MLTAVAAEGLAGQEPSQALRHTVTGTAVIFAVPAHYNPLYSTQNTAVPATHQRAGCQFQIFSIVPLSAVVLIGAQASFEG